MNILERIDHLINLNEFKVKHPLLHYEQAKYLDKFKIISNFDHLGLDSRIRYSADILEIKEESFLKFKGNVNKVTKFIENSFEGQYDSSYTVCDERIYYKRNSSDYLRSIRKDYIKRIYESDFRLITSNPDRDYDYSIYIIIT